VEDEDEESEYELSMVSYPPDPPLPLMAYPPFVKLRCRSILKTLSGFQVYSGGQLANIFVLILGKKHLFSGNFYQTARRIINIHKILNNTKISIYKISIIKYIKQRRQREKEREKLKQFCKQEKCVRRGRRKRINKRIE